MSTYLNAFAMLEQVRLAIDEYEEDITQGVETADAFDNDYIMQKINNAQRFIYYTLFPRSPEWFLTSTTAAFSSSSYTLPTDFGSIHQLRDENGFKVYRIKASQSRITDNTGDDSHYYQKGNTYVLDRDSVTKNYTLWYHTKPRELNTGRVTATGTLTMTLDTSASKLVDYYNDVTIENVSADWVDTIDDYTTGRVATISETSVNINDIYGTVSELPEMFHFLIPMKATLDIMSEHPSVQRSSNAGNLNNFNEYLRTTITAFGVAFGDINISDMLNSYSPSVGSSRVILIN